MRGSGGYGRVGENIRNVILRGNKKVRKCISVWTLVSRARDGDSLEWRMSEKEMNGGGLGDSRASLRSGQAAIRAMAGTSTDANPIPSAMDIYPRLPLP